MATDPHTRLSLSATPGRRSRFTVNVAASPVALSLTVLAPVITLSVAAAPVVLNLSVVAPATSMAQAPAPISTTVSIQAPTTALRQSLSSVGITCSVVPPTLALQQSPPPLALACTVVEPALSTNLTVGPVSSVLSVVTPLVGVAAVASPIPVTVSVLPPTTSLGATVAAVPLTLSIPALVFGETTNPTPVGMVLSVVEPTVSMSLAVAPVSVTLSVVTPSASTPIAYPAPLGLTLSVVQPTVVFGALPPPQNTAYTKLLLHCNEPAGTVDLIDEAVGGTSKTITAVGDAAIALDPKFDYAALGLAASGSYLKIDPTSDFDFSTDDFTIEFWTKVRDAGRAFLLTMSPEVAGAPDPDNRLSLELVNRQGDAVELVLRYRVSGTDLFTLTSPTNELTNMQDLYRHVALVRWGTLWTLYIHGTKYAQATVEDAEGDTAGDPIDMDLSSWTTWLGGSFRTGVDGSGADEFLTADALFDEVRVETRAVWQSDFVPPTSQYTPRYEVAAWGGSRVYNAQEATARGTSNLAAYHFTHQVLGVSNVRNAYQQEVVGRSHVRNSFESAARGATNVIKRTFMAVCSGGVRVYNAVSSTALGIGRVLTERFTSEVRGVSTVRQRFESTASGGGRVLQAFTQQASGAHRSEDTTVEGYELYHALDAEPVLSGTPDVVSATLPFDSLVISGEGKHYFVVRQRNRFGVVSGNILSTVIELDGEDNEINVTPRAPEAMAVEGLEGSKLKVTAEYLYTADGALQADGFAIYRAVGIMGSMDYVETVEMVKADGIARLNWESTETFGTTTVIVEVRARRSSDERDSAAVTGGINFLTALPVDPPEALEVAPL